MLKASLNSTKPVNHPSEECHTFIVCQSNGASVFVIVPYMSIKGPIVYNIILMPNCQRVNVFMSHQRLRHAVNITLTLSSRNCLMRFGPRNEGINRTPHAY